MTGRPRGGGVSSAWPSRGPGCPLQLRGAPRRAPPGPPELSPNCPERRWARGDSARGAGSRRGDCVLEHSGARDEGGGGGGRRPRAGCHRGIPVPLPPRPARPRPPRSRPGEGRPRFGTTLASHSCEDAALACIWELARSLSFSLYFIFFLSVFIFWRGAPSNCPEHMLLPPSVLQPPATASPLFCIYHFPSPFFIKGPGAAAANQRSASIL